MDVKSGVTFNNVTFFVQMFDLTLIFGAGNEPATVAEFESMFPESYYPYNAGELLNVNIEGIAIEDAGGAALDALGIPVLTYFPTGMKSAGSVYDELTRDKAITRIGRVDLGTLTWITASTNESGVLRWRNNSVADISAKKPSANNVNANIVCVKYPTSNASATYSKTYGIDIDTNGYIHIYDPNYTASSDHDALAASLNGVYLYYELAEPIITEINPSLDLYYYIKNHSTELLVTDISLPKPQTASVPMTIIYGANVPPLSTVYKKMTGKNISISNPLENQLHSLKIYGKSIQNGTPTPEAPIPVDVVNRYNLLRNADLITTSEMALTRSTVPTNGTIKLKPTTSAAYAKFKVDYLDYEQYGTGEYTVSFDAMLAEDETTYTSSNLMVYLGFNVPSRLGSVFSGSYDRYTSAQTVASDTIKPLSTTT